MLAVITDGKKNNVDLEYNLAYGYESLPKPDKSLPLPEETDSSLPTKHTTPKDHTPSQVTVSAVNPTSQVHYEDVDSPLYQNYEDVSADDKPT